jgi:oligopeptidase B
MPRLRLARAFPFLALSSLILGGCASNSRIPGPFRSAMRDAPPVAKRLPHPTRIHGETRADDYFWLREKTNPEVRAYLEAENAWADQLTAHTAPLRDRLFAEMKARIKETDISVPYRIGDWEYFSRTQKGQQYPTYFRRPREGGEARVVLDVNELAKGQKFMATGTMTISPDGALMAYTTDNTGFREYTLHVKSLVDDREFSEAIAKVDGVAWSSDNKTLFYVVQDAAKRPYRLHRHALDTNPKDDEMVYEEKDERFRLAVWLTLSHDFLVLQSDSLTTKETHLLPADRPSGSFRVVKPRQQDHEYSVTQRGDRLFIRTNDRGKNFRLVTASTENPAEWTEMIPHRDDVMLERVRAFADFLVLTERKNGLRSLRFIDDGGGDHDLPLTESVYEIGVGTNAEFTTDTFRYTYQSMITPRSVFDYDVRKRQSRLLKQIEVLGGYNADAYQTERIFARAADGTAIPISLVRRKDTPRDGSAPVYLIGYGSYGAPYPATFSHARLSLLDRGVICAIAHVRGGGELGKKWHDGGRMSHKRNTFTDFIACGEHLVRERYAHPNRLIAHGGSAGGLLMGAIVNMRPDLFRVVILDVPFVDVINTMLDESLPLTVGEFEEWGNPKIKKDYDYIRTYCPYSNLFAGAYPTMLVKTSFDDSQVMYWEPAKYVARLRQLKTNQTQLVFKTNMAGGHGGSSGRYDAWKETAFNYAFLLDQLGIRD